jgi:hypothetical protein
MSVLIGTACAPSTAQRKPQIRSAGAATDGLGLNEPQQDAWDVRHRLI